MSLMLPGGGLYAPNAQAMHSYGPGMRRVRSDALDAPSGALRSQLLDEFRANKARKWELRVSHALQISHPF